MSNRPDVLGVGPQMGRRSLGRDRATEGAVDRYGKRWIVIEGGDGSSLSSSCIWKCAAAVTKLRLSRSTI